MPNTAISREVAPLSVSDNGSARNIISYTALSFVVYPTEEARGLMRIEGRWSADIIAVA